MTSSLSITEGTEVQCGDRCFVIRQVLGFDTVVAEDAETGALERLGVADLRRCRRARAALRGRDYEPVVGVGPRGRRRVGRE